MMHVPTALLALPKRHLQGLKVKFEQMVQSAWRPAIESAEDLRRLFEFHNSEVFEIVP
jgi:hypothetical protein